jgi:hypothetical protein
MESDNSLYIEKWKGDKGKLKDKNPVQTSI